MEVFHWCRGRNFPRCWDLHVSPCSCRRESQYTFFEKKVYSFHTLRTKISYRSPYIQPTLRSTTKISCDCNPLKNLIN